MVKPFTNATWRESPSKDVCLDSATSDCMGHHAYDLTVFQARVMNGDGTFSVGMYTNGELMAAADPGDYKLDYVYDSFLWEHCDEAGFYFPKLDWRA